MYKLKHNGKAAFYATIWQDIQNVVIKYGYEAALHGSLSRDMDIIIVPWREDCVSIETLINAIIKECFRDNDLAVYGTKYTYNEKPHGRKCYSIPICEGFYLDISLIEPKLK